MKHDNPIQEHWFRFPDLALFPDYANEPRADREIDLEPLHEALNVGDYARFMKLMGTRAKWTQRMRGHFEDIRKPPRHSKKVKHQCFEDIYETGWHVCELDTEYMWAQSKQVFEMLLSREDREPPPGTYDRIAPVPSLPSYLNKIFGEMGVLDSLVSYWGKDISVANVMAIPSTPTDYNWRQFLGDGARTPKFTNAHIDPKQTIKAIIYLDDVGLKQGPFSWVPTSHRFVFDRVQEVVARTICVGNYMHTPELRAQVFDLPSPLRVSMNFGRCLFEQDPMYKQMETHMVRMTSNMGNCAIFDAGNGIHQGGNVEKGQRIALQVLFK